MAASNETELERLVVRLTGDVAQYLKAIEEARRKTEEEAKNISVSADQIGTAFAAVGATITAVFGKIGYEAIAEWGSAEMVGIKLGAVLTSNARDVIALREEYKEFASELQKVTRLGDDTTLGLLSMAETFDLTGDSAKKAVREAAAFAVINDTNAESMIRLTAAVAKGDIETAMMFSRMVPQLRGVKDEHEFLARYQKIVAAGFAAEAQATATYQGQLTQLKNDFGDFKEIIGRVIAEGLIPLVQHLKELAVWLQGLPPWVQKAIGVTIGLGLAMGVLLASVGAGILVWKNLIATTLQYVATAKAASIAIGALTAVALAGLVAMLAQVIFTAAGGTEALKEFRAELERGRKLFDEIEGIRTKRRASALESALFGDDPIEVRNRLRAELDLAEKNLIGTTAALNSAKRELENLVGAGTTRGAVDAIIREIPLIGSGKVSELEAAEARVKEARAAYTSLKDHIAKLTEELAKVTDPIDAGTKRSLMAGLVGGVEGILMVAEASKSADDFTKSLGMSMRTMGMTADEARLLELRLSGVGESSLANARGLIAMKRELEAIEALMTEGAAVTEQFRSPIERFNDEIDRLAYLFGRGAISEEIFEAATAGANRELMNTMQTAKAAADQVLRLDNALSGSAEGQSRIFEFMQRNELTSSTRRTATQASGAPYDPGRDQSLALLARIARAVETSSRQSSLTLKGANLQ